MIPAPTYHLRDLILAEARARGFDLDEYAFRLEQDLPVLRLRLGPRVLWGCRVRLPGEPGLRDHAPDVITVHGARLGGSKMWPRKRDGSFDIAAVAGHLVKLIEQELLLPRPEINVPSGTFAAESGLHVIHLAAVRLGVVAPDSRAEQLMEQITDAKTQGRIQGRLRRNGLTDGDIRALCGGVGLSLTRSLMIGGDPFEPISPRHMSILKIGNLVAEKSETRFVLLLEHRGDRLELADPAGKGLTSVTARELDEDWRLGGTQGKPWIGYVKKSRFATGM